MGALWSFCYKHVAHLVGSKVPKANFCRCSQQYRITTVLFDDPQIES